MQHQRLLEHLAFVRSLCRHLADDPDRREEIEQRTVQAALTSSPRQASSTRSWLAAIARNAARRLGVSGSRRLRREQAAARSERLPAADEQVVRREMTHRVIEEVFALEEPYRSTILARFYDELSPREIARRQGVPVETVRTRLKRAQTILRARLDEEYGSRDAWAIVLAPLGAPIGGVPWLDLQPREWIHRMQEVSAMLFTTKTGAALVTAAVLGILGWHWRLSDGGMSFPSRGIDSEVVEPEFAREAPASSPIGTAPATTSAASSAAPLVPVDDDDAGSTEAATLTVRTLWEDGTPAPSVGVFLARAIDPATGQAWYSHREREGVTDASGQVTFAGLVAGSFTVVTDRRGYEIEVLELEGGSAVTREITIPRGADIEGLVVDPDGQPVPGARIWLGSRSREDFARVVHITLSDGAGRFQVRGLQPDHVIGARATSWSPSRGVIVGSLPHASEGEPDVELQLGGPAGKLVGRVIDADGAPIANAQIFAGHGVSWRPGGDDARPDGRRFVDPSGHFARSSADGHFEMIGVAPHAVLFVEAMALGLAPFEGHFEILPGQTTQAEIRLHESPRVFGCVTDGEGNPVPGISVFWGSERHSLTTQTRGESDAEGRYQLRGLPIGECQLSIPGADPSSDQTTVADLEPGEELEWNVVVGGPTDRSIEGRIVDPIGQPLPDWVASYQVSSGRANDDGHFRIPDTRMGVAIPLLISSPLGFPAFVTDKVAPGESDCTLVVPESAMPSAFVIGRLTGKAPRHADAIRLSIQFERRVWERWSLKTARVQTPVVTGEAFRIGPISPGEYSIFLDIEELPRIALGTHELSASQVLDIGTIELRDPGSLSLKASVEGGEVPRRMSMTLVSEGGTRIELGRESDRFYSGMMHPGSYRLEWTGRGIESQSRDIEIAPGVRFETEVSLRRAALVELKIWLPESAEIAALEEADVRSEALRRAYGRHHVRVRLLDAEGALVAEAMSRCPGWSEGELTGDFSVPAGQYFVEAASITGLSASAQITAGAPDDPREPIDLVLN
ncbi:MAG: sigma-70 family RNA polymerase sigma factor [Planctomycetota bacterium]